MYKAKIHGKSFEVAPDHGTWRIGGNPFEWDIADLGNGHYHILYQNTGYQAELVRIDTETKTVELKINNMFYSIALQDKFDLLLEKMGMSATQVGKVNVIKAPMPGLIIDLRVKAGDVVQKGDPLLVLEAMKMENSIKAPGEGTVKAVNVKKGDTVEKSQVLIEF